MSNAVGPPEGYAEDLRRQMEGAGETFDLEVVTNVRPEASGLVVTKLSLTIRNGRIVGKGEPRQERVRVTGHAV